jgi:hypothetical protein
MAINSKLNASTSVAPFIATKGYLLQLGIKLDSPIYAALSKERLSYKDAKGIATRMHNVISFMRENVA